MPVLRPDQVATYLTSTYWAESGETARKWNIAPGGTLDVRIEPIGAREQEVTELALKSWTYITGINFKYTWDRDAAEIRFTNEDDGAYSWSTGTKTGVTTKAEVNISWEWSWTYGNSIDTYYMQTVVHEIGHVLGLGHPGQYNGESIWGRSNWFDNDSWQMSVMSYFAPDECKPVRGSFAYAVTPMPADIIAAHRLYGKPTGVGTGDTVYGWNSNAGGIYGYIGKQIAAGKLYDPIMFTIYDQGGSDTVDMSGDTRNQVARMEVNQFSDVLGVKGCLGIAYETVIENWRAGSGHDVLNANAAANKLWGMAGNDRLLGLGGNDMLDGGVGNDRLDGGAGNDHLIGGSGRDTLLGGDGTDRLFGQNDDDQLDGGAGDDTLDGGAGNDALLGGAGRDRLTGMAGNDRLDGGADADTLTGDDGNDALLGGTGNDSILGGNGLDSLWGGAGNDLLDGGNDNDVLDGGDGDDRLLGQGGNDRLLGLLGNDFLDGGIGNDTLDGGAGNDRLYGGAGNDRIMCGAGADLIWGGAGSDCFVFTRSSDSTPAASDRIGDFRAGADVLDFRAFSLDRNLGTAGFTGRGDEMRQQRVGGDLHVSIDLNGDKVADLRVILTGCGTLHDTSFLI